LFVRTYRSRTGAAVFQLTYQIKILTTAIMSTLMLGRILTTKAAAAAPPAVIHTPQGHLGACELLPVELLQ
jgi:hypothetical protein